MTKSRGDLGWEKGLGNTNKHEGAHQAGVIQSTIVLYSATAEHRIVAQYPLSRTETLQKVSDESLSHGLQTGGGIALSRRDVLIYPTDPGSRIMPTRAITRTIGKMRRYVRFEGASRT